MCLFSYGQTGSGKTHTMLGGPAGGADAGIIPRSVEAVLGAAERLGAKGWRFSMSASYVEIYNEQARSRPRPRRPPDPALDPGCRTAWPPRRCCGGSADCYKTDYKM